MIKVTAAIIVDSGKVFIAKRKPPGRMPGMWEFPGGKIEEGETPEQCLKRELHEELGIDAAIGRHIGTRVYEYDFYTVLFGIGRAIGVLCNIVWDRALGYAIERPKSLTTAMLEEIAGIG